MPETIRLEGPISLVGAEEHPHAARRLREALPSLQWQEVASPVEGTPVVRLRRDDALPEGAFSLSVEESSNPPAVEVAGGPFSGVIYGVEELIQRRARQVGNAVGVAMFGALAATTGVINGVHTSALIASGAFLAGALLALFARRRRAVAAG